MVTEASHAHRHTIDEKRKELEDALAEALARRAKVKKQLTDH